MRVLLFTLEYPPFHGGVAKYYQHIVEDWPRPDNIFVLHNNDGKLLAKSIWPHWLPAIWRLYRAIKKNKINHVIVGHILPLGTVTWLVAKFTGIKYSVILHGLDFASAGVSQRKRRLRRLILAGAQDIICNSHFVAAKVAKAFPNIKNKIQAVHPGVRPRGLLDYKLDLRLKTKYNLENKMPRAFK